MNTIYAYDLGRAPYRETWDLQAKIQQRLIAQKLSRASVLRDGTLIGVGGTTGDLTPSVTSGAPGVSGGAHDVLLFVEHPHVYTMGKSGKSSHLFKTDDELAELDASFVQIDRGGDITYHGPGQIVGYPVLDLDRYFTDIHKYLRLLEEVSIRLCADYGIQAGRIEKLTGVWVGDAKICAFGIKCSRWVTMHGFALNVNTHLDYFGHIVPCGIRDKSVTSLASLLGHPVDMSEVKDRISYHFGEIFGASIERMAGLPPEADQISGFSPRL